jgi:hypothetical protein
MGYAAMDRFTDWPSFFHKVRVRPGQWFGEQSITALQHFINGIKLAAHLYEVPVERELGGFSFEDFERWTDGRFNPDRLSVNSFDLARRSSESETEAFQKWFGWYDQFRSEPATPEV